MTARRHILRRSLSFVIAMTLLFVLLPEGGRNTAIASHSGDEPLLRVTGSDECDPRIAPRDGPSVESHRSIVIVGDEGPTGFIVGHDPITGEPIPREGSGVREGTGTPEDPYVISGWLIEQANSGITIRDTSAHVVVRDNRLAHHASHPVVLEEAANVRVAGNIIETNVGSGVRVVGPAPNVTVTDNAFFNNQRALHAVGVDGLVVTRNVALENRGAGIEVSGGSDVRIEDNVVQDAADSGILVDANSGSRVECNRVTGAPVGIEVTGASPDAVVVHNTVTDNGFGVILSDSHRSQITGNEVERSTGFGESTGIFVYESHDVVVAGNHLSVARFGVVVRRSHNNDVIGNTFTDNTWGLFCTGNSAGGTPSSPEGADGTTIRGNTFQGHSRSVMLRECTHTFVEENDMSDHDFDGIHDFEGTNNTHRNNQIRGAPRAAIYLWRLGGHTVTGNHITGSDHGIRLYDARDNHVHGNELKDNHHGVVVRDDDNRITGNHFIGMTGVGVYLFEGANAIVTGNGIVGNRHGVVVATGHSGGLLEDNDIQDNTQTGLLVQRDPPFAAPNNWWGCSEGPGAPGCDLVEGNADTEPWRTSPVPGIARPPVLEAIDDPTVAGGETVTIEVVATDPDGDAITLEVIDPPRRAVFTDHGDGTGLFEWSTTRGDHGSHAVSFRARSGWLSDAQEVTVEVQKETGPPRRETEGIR